jgi:DNA polymerase
VADRGRALVAGDFSGIEARIVLALAGQHDKCDLLASGQDVYCTMASAIYGRPILPNPENQPPERQLGKETVLGAGFQMGWQKFQSRLKQKGIVISDEQAQDAINGYRQKFAPLVPLLWKGRPWEPSGKDGLEDASLAAVKDGLAHEAFGVTYQKEDGWLTARLPSGRKLWYFNPQLIRKAMPWDETDVRLAWTYQVKKMGQWKTIDAYGGHETENVVQALARDIMAAAMFKCEKNGFPVILTVHDEIVCEPEEWAADPVALKQIMTDVPEWARQMQIPIAAETWAGDRYRK